MREENDKKVIDLVFFTWETNGVESLKTYDYNIRSIKSEFRIKSYDQNIDFFYLCNKSMRAFLKTHTFLEARMRS